MKREFGKRPTCPGFDRFRIANLTSTFSYFGNNDDRRLQTILNKKGTTTLSQFDYTYDDEGQMSSWKRNGLATADAITYDTVGQLKTYSKANSSGGPTLHTYNYDTAGNRDQELIAATTTRGGDKRR